MPWHHGWNVLAVGLVFQAVSFGLAIYCFTLFVAPWAEEFATGRGDVMTIFLGLQIGMGALAPFAGRAMDRLPIRVLVCGGALCLASALALSARAQQLWQLNLVYATLGVAGALLAGPLRQPTEAIACYEASLALDLPEDREERGLLLGVARDDRVDRRPVDGRHDRDRGLRDVDRKSVV